MKFKLSGESFKYGICGLFIAALLGIAGGNSAAVTVLISAAGFVSGLFLPFVIKKRQKKKERRMYDLDMADYLVTVSLLLSSGLNIWDALKRGMEGFDIERPLFREIGEVFKGYESGALTDLADGFQNMSLKLRIPSVSTFVCAVIQNCRKGSGEISGLFMDMSNTYRSQRRITVSKMADEATTLLLIPSTMVLIALIVILVAPAVMQLAVI